MTPSSDPSQYGNEKGIGTQHYLIKMINRILTCLDTNNSKEAYAVISQLIDWRQAFDRQCPKLGIQSFIANGVRKSILPVLINYFQDRKMQVKWHGIISTLRDMAGGGPQGCHLGQLEYSSQSNDSGACVASEDRFKFVDDMSLLEVINLITIGITSYNFRNHVASDISTDQKFLPPQNCSSQSYLDSVQQWTDSKLMELNQKKTKAIIFNFTYNYQFSTRLYIQETLLEIVNQTKLLGTIITSDLTWWENTNYITRKAYSRLEILRRLCPFSISTNDLVLIYTLYVRSMLEFNCCVWTFNITKAEVNEIERVQKVACRIILQDDYSSYENALETLNLDNLKDRRKKLSINFAKKSLKNQKTKYMFPLNAPDSHHIRGHDKYKVNHANTGRLLNSAIPQMQRLLNA